MDAFQNVLAIHRDESGPRFKLAVELLLERGEMLLLEQFVVLVPGPSAITCEVITRHIAQPVNPLAYERELAEARELLESSTIAQALTDRPLKWCVVDDYGMGRSVVWPAG